jgi:hypothetical protein
LGGERLLHDPPVPVVLAAVEQHQATPEERADEERPAGATVEGVVAVAQHLAARVGTLRRHPRLAEGLHPGHRTVLVVAPAIGGHPPGGELQGVADDG